MRHLLLLPLVVLSVFACAQEKPTRPKKTAPVSVDMKSPVTKAEARAVFVKAAAILKPVIKAQFASPTLPMSSAPVTRTEVVSEMHRMFVAASSAFKYTPVKVAFDRNRLTLKDAKQKQNLERLIAFGTVAKLGPLATDAKETVSVHDFGDAIGFFMTRIADLTHLPSAKWTPELQTGE